MEINKIIYISIIFIVAIVISIYDILYRRIPNRWIALLGLVAILKFVYLNKFMQKSPVDFLVGMLLGFGIFIIATIQTGKIGFGDTKLIAMVGLNLGICGVLKTILIMGMAVFAYFIGYSIKNKTLSFKIAIPLGPFIMFGMICQIGSIAYITG